MMKKAKTFYHLLAKLLWCLRSGKLCNRHLNPFVAKSVFIPIFVADDNHK